MSPSNEQGIHASGSRTERAVRVAVGSIGVVLLGVGLHKLWLLPDRASTLKWALAPIVIHDVLVAPTVCLLGWGVSRFLPSWTRPALLQALSSRHRSSWFHYQSSATRALRVPTPPLTRGTMEPGL